MTEGWLYFLQEGEGGAIKIGWTQADPEGRRRHQQTGNSSELRLIGQIRAPYLADASWQKRFAAHRKRSEWFWPASVLMAAIVVAIEAPPVKVKPADATQGVGDVRAWMARTGLTIDTLAERIGFARSYVAEKLCARSQFSAPMAAALEIASEGELSAEALIKSQQTHSVRLVQTNRRSA